MGTPQPDQGGGNGIAHGRRRRTGADRDLTREGGGRQTPDAAEGLGKLTQFYYNVLYVVTQDKAVDANDQVNAQARQWLKDQKFPVGHILVLPSDPAAFGAKLDDMHAAGWKTLKIGGAHKGLCRRVSAAAP